MEFENRTLEWSDKDKGGAEDELSRRILVVDDEPHVVSALYRLLKDEYRVDTATTRDRALDSLKRNEYAIIIADQRMPEMTGVELLTKTLKLQPDATRILLTGYADIHSLISAVNSAQIYHYIVKPWNPDDLQLILKGGRERYALKRKIHLYVEELKLQHAELQKAYDKLQSLDGAKRHFLNIISHELKTPLTTILAYADTLLSDIEEGRKYGREEQLQFMQKIQDAAEYLHRLIDDAIDLTALQTGKLELKWTPCDLSRAIEHAIERLTESAQRKDITIEKRIPPVRIRGDFMRLIQIFERTLEHAVSNAQTGEKLNITAVENRSFEDESLFGSPSLLITLCAAGRAESEAAHAKAPAPFSPLSPAEESLLHYRSGQGLNLSLCHALVELHGGRFTISRGSEESLAYHIILPLKQREE